MLKNYLTLSVIIGIILSFAVINNFLNEDTSHSEDSIIDPNPYATHFSEFKQTLDKSQWWTNEEKALLLSMYIAASIDPQGDTWKYLANRGSYPDTERSFLLKHFPCADNGCVIELRGMGNPMDYDNQEILPEFIITSNHHSYDLLTKNFQDTRNKNSEVHSDIRIAQFPLKIHTVEICSDTTEESCSITFYREDLEGLPSITYDGKDVLELSPKNELCLMLNSPFDKWKPCK